MICEEVLIDVYIYISSTNSPFSDSVTGNCPRRRQCFECLMSLHGSKQDICV